MFEDVEALWYILYCPNIEFPFVSGICDTRTDIRYGHPPLFLSFFLSLAASLSLSHTHPILLCLCPSLSLHPPVSLLLSRSLCLFFSPLHPLSFYTYLYICMYLFSELSIICSNNYIIGLHYARIQCFITIGDFKTSFFQQISLNDVYVYF